MTPSLCHAISFGVWHLKRELKSGIHGAEVMGTALDPGLGKFPSLLQNPGS